MRLKQVQLKKFKRFDDLTIDLGERPKKVVALVGPNGCGKSSVFDAFEQILQNYVGLNQPSPEPSFFSKSWFDSEHPVQAYNKNEAIRLTAEDGTSNFQSKHFYVRSAYRFTTGLRVTSIQATADILTDPSRPGGSTRLDQRLQANYERMLGRLLYAFWEEGKTGKDIRSELVEAINQRLARVLDIQISELGNVPEGKGQLFFEKGSSKNFPFENLSAGEKEVVDILIDLVVKAPVFNDTVFCIDEPELHLNTAIQRKLLKEIVELIPDSCQLWVATHSIGFLRSLQEDLKDQSHILDFSERDYFSGAWTIHPMSPTRMNWQRIFSTALEDLTGLIAPTIAIYCEGRPEPTPEGSEQGLDARIYNQIFQQEFSNALFISSGGGNASTKSSQLALKVLSKAFHGVTLLLLKDRDNLTDTERSSFIEESPSNRMLSRHEIENYLFDFAIVERLSAANGVSLSESSYKEIIPMTESSDLKPIAQKLQHACGHKGKVEEFKIDLASFITPDTLIYTELKACIFDKPASGV